MGAYRKRGRQKHIVPTDWDGERWACVQLQWPWSPQWFDLLFSIIEQLTWWTAWDQQGASFNDAIIAAQEVITRSWPLIGCSGTPVSPAPPDISAGTGAGYSEGDDDMPCIDISNLLKIENGILYARDSCCVWVEIGNLATISEPATNPFEGDDPQPEYSACGKAASVMYVANLVMGGLFDAIAGSPAFWVPTVRAAVPGYETGYQSILSACAYLSVAGLLYSEAEMRDATGIAGMTCVIEQFFTADGAAMTQAQFTDIKSAIKGYWLQHTGDTTIGSVWVSALDVLGKTDVSNAAVMGATDTAANCDCPSVELPADPTPEWDDLAWAHFFDWTTGEHGWGMGDPPQDQTAQGLITDPVDGNGFAALVAAFTAVAGTEITVKRVEVRWEADAGFDYAGEHKVKVGSQDLLVMSVDTDPSGGGSFRQTQNTNYSFTNEQAFVWLDNGYAAEGNRDLGDGIRFLSLSIGGNGRDPFV